MNRWRWVVLAALLCGALLRLPRLDLRPMHTDEAVHAVKFGTLLETGVYRYDRNEYHGPTLNYFTLLPAWVAGERSFSDLSEGTLRIVPALFGIGLILLILSLRAAGPAAIAAAAFLAASSPMLAYYSRYYIQETLLVFFAMALIVSGYRFVAAGRTRWAVAAGVSAGLMFATKETWIISAGLMGVSLLAVALIRRREGAGPLPIGFRAVFAGAAAGIAVALLFFSSFFSHWEGVRDSVLAYETYFGRAGGESRHGHPWHYFLRMLLWWHDGRGPVWTEAAILAPAACGIIGAFFEKRVRGGAAGDLRLFVAVYSLLMLLVASVIPYKTPWLVLGALSPLVLMAGWGVSDFIGWLPSRLKIAGVMLVALLGGHLLWQSYMANFKYYDDPSNPMVYAHPTDDVKRIGEILDTLSRSAPEPPPVQVVVADDQYWPLPWYLRRLPRVGWWNNVTEEFVPTPVILFSPDREEALLKRLYETPAPGERPLYVPLFDRPMLLRPGCEIRGVVTLDLSNRLPEVSR